MYSPAITDFTFMVKVRFVLSGRGLILVARIHRTCL